MRVIGIDPSLTATGIAAIDLLSKQVVAWTCIQTKPNPNLKKMEDTARRVIQIRDGIRTFLDEHHGVHVVEGLAGYKGQGSVGSAFKMGLGYAVVLGTLPGKPVIVPAASVKERLLGKGQGGKRECFEAAMKGLHGHPEWPKNKPSREAVRDAVSVAIAAKPELEQILAAVQHLT